MNRSKELIKNTIIVALGKICTQFVTFFLLPIYTRYLTTEEYGFIDLILTCSCLIAPIISLQLERSIFRFLIDARKDKEQQDSIISTAFFTVIVVVMIATMITPLIGLIANIKYIAYITLLLIATVATNVLLQIPRGLGKNTSFSIAGMIIGILNAVISIFLTVFLNQGVKGVLIAGIISQLIGIVYLSITTKLISRLSINRKDKALLKKMLKFSIPMIPSDIVYWIISTSDRLIISIILGSSANGIYATATKFPSLIVTAYNIFNLSWIETVSVHIHDKDAPDFIKKTFNAVINVACSVCCIITAVIPLVFNIVIGEKYLESYNYISILNIGAFYNIVIGALSAVYFGSKRTKDIAKTNLLAAILNVIINVIFIRKIGIYAAAISTALAYLIVSIYRITNIQKTTPIKIRVSSLLLPSAILLANHFLYMFNTKIVIIANISTMLIISLVLNRKLIVKILTTITKQLQKERK